MALKISSDVDRFNKKLDTLRRQGLDRYIAKNSVPIPSPSGKILEVPIDSIDIPRFVFGEKKMGGVGMGNGSKGDSAEIDSQSTAKHSASFNPDELADYLIEKLNLPNLHDLHPSSSLDAVGNKYTAISRNGPKGLRTFKRSFRNALARSIASGSYDSTCPLIIPRNEDFRYRFPEATPKPTPKLAVGYVLDHSGSTEPVLNYFKMVAHFTSVLLGRFYGKSEEFFVHFDSGAREVRREEFFTVSSAGSTDMRKGLLECRRILDLRYPLSDYERYVVLLTDGDFVSVKDEKPPKALIDLVGAINCFFVANAVTSFSSASPSFDVFLRAHLKDSTRFRIYSTDETKATKSEGEHVAGAINTFFK
jgi:uncharacterized sporulation protein YeaH/YhbH (DUF444 family)